MKYLPMTRFELRTLGVGSDRSTIWPTPLPIFFNENIFTDLGGAVHFHRIIQTATEVQLAVGILRTTSGGNDCPSVALDMAVVPEVLLARSEYSVDSGLDDFKAGLWDLFNSTFGNVLPRVDTNSFLNGHPRHLFRLFSSFQTHYNSYNKYMWKNAQIFSGSQTQPLWYDEISENGLSFRCFGRNRIRQDRQNLSVGGLVSLGVETVRKSSFTRATLKCNCVRL